MLGGYVEDELVRTLTYSSESSERETTPTSECPIGLTLNCNCFRSCVNKLVKIC